MEFSEAHDDLKGKGRLNRLQSLREAVGIDVESLGLALNLDAESVERCEADLEEALDTLDLQQWATWASQMGLPLVEMLAQIGACSPGQVHPLTFRELRDALGVLAAQLGGPGFVEEKTGWEVGAFLRDPEEGWTRKLPFFKSVAQAVGRDWRGLAAAYGAPP